MKDARIQKIMEGLKGSTEQRAEAWEMFCHSCSDLDLDDLKFRRVLEALIRKPTDDATRELQELRFELHRLIDLVAVRPWARRPKAPLEDWFFRPFRPTPRLSNPCGVVGICDREYIRDVQAQILLARRLSIERYPDTKFCYLALSNPVWSDVELERINALCVLGRPSMFARCAILEALAEQRRSARFALPGDNDRWRGQPLTPDSAAIFHHVVQRSPWGEPKLYGAVDQNGSRTDYALVQRFRILYSGRPVTIIVLAGATSLGTIGAVDWVAGSGLVNALKAGCHWLGKSDLAEDSEVEALLRVRADVRNPARPWGHVECAPVKLFIDDSVNLAPGESPAEPVAPKIVTLVMCNGKPEAVLLDDDEVRFGGRAFTVLVAVCRMACHNAGQRVGAGAVLDIEDMLGRGELGPFSDVDALTLHLRDHLQRRHLGKAVQIEGGELRFYCEIRRFDYTKIPGL